MSSTTTKPKHVRRRNGKSYRKPNITNQMRGLRCQRFNTTLRPKIQANWEKYLSVPDNILTMCGIETAPALQEETFSTCYMPKDGQLKTLIFRSVQNPGVPQLALQKGTFLEMSDTVQGQRGVQLCFVNITKRNNKTVFDGNLQLRILVKTEQGWIFTPYILDTEPVNKNSTPTPQCTCYCDVCVKASRNGPSIPCPNVSTPLPALQQSPQISATRAFEGYPESTEGQVQQIPAETQVEPQHTQEQSPQSQDHPLPADNLVENNPLGVYPPGDYKQPQVHPPVHPTTVPSPYGGSPVTNVPPPVSPWWDDIVLYPTPLELEYPSDMVEVLTSVSLFPSEGFP
ncbi:hypothetical protein Pelo_2650 [Pelomyxa schiedti]|nr:hypothetical protein Pelo_2650 [Pelomyxa schiedti]